MDVQRKVVAIHQPNYLPWPGFFNKIYNSDIFIILDTVDYQTGNAKSVTNRTKLKSNQGELLLTENVKKSDSKVLKDIIFDNAPFWKKKHLTSIQQNYKKAQHFNDVYPIIEKMFEASIDSLSVFNAELIMQLCNYLEIATPIVYASTLDCDHEDKNLRLINLCKKVEANVYLSGMGAKSYNDHELYKEHGIDIEYNNYTVKEYRQLYGDFIPYLSMLDVVLNIGKAAIHIIE